LRRLAVVLIAGSALVTGCSSGTNTGDDLQVADTVTAATPADSPALAKTPAGTVLPLGQPATAITVDTAQHTAAVAVDNPPSLRLYDLTSIDAPPKTIDLPGRVDNLSTVGDVVLAPVRTANQLLRITLPAGAVDKITLPGGPVAASTNGTQTLVALHDTKSVAVLTGDKTDRTITGLASADQALQIGDKAVVLDKLRTAVFDLDPATGKLGAGLRAGDGATNAVTDNYGRVLVTDRRGGELLVYKPDTLVELQQYPVPGAPYAIAYDPQRHLAWVTLTATNQVVGYDVAGGEPVEKHRIDTVRQPNSVAVDPTTGRVLVASADGGGIQVINP
jgi:DNA-binding beta-propeller fold protein YncE